MASGVVPDRESPEYIMYLKGQMAAAKGDSNSTTAIFNQEEKKLNN